MGCGIEKNDCLLTMYDVLLGYTDINQNYSESGKFDVLPSNADLTAAEVELLQLPNKEYALKNSLELVESNYDFILIDCPPSLNILTVNAMAASHGVIIPIQCEVFCSRGPISFNEYCCSSWSGTQPKNCNRRVSKDNV